MDESRKKAQESRARNLEAQSKRINEQTESIRVARLALQKVMESADATPDQILEAGRLLVQIGRY